GIFELEGIVRQLGLRLAHAGLGELPEVRRAIHHEGERLLVRGLGAGAERQRQPGHGGEPREIMDLHAFPPVRLVKDAGLAGSILILYYHMNEIRERQSSSARRQAGGRQENPPRHAAGKMWHRSAAIRAKAWIPTSNSGRSVGERPCWTERVSPSGVLAR